ncbi:MAG: ORF6N domain-containing protein [Chitinispirillales bacterium]|nr:ORF6N domain-containing protein [Chitinispirillales bacterium]
MNNKLIISQTQIENLIFTVRGVQVMLDRDLAEMYEVETRAVNQAVKRNVERFPKEYCFQLTEKEAENLTKVQSLSSVSRSQIVILNDKRGQNIKYLPHVFTEQGVAMLSAVLRSDVAIKVSIQIMNAFVQLRKIVQNNQLVYSRLDKVEQKQFETDQKIEQVFKALEGNTIPTQGVH